MHAREVISTASDSTHGSHDRRPFDIRALTTQVEKNILIQMKIIIIITTNCLKKKDK